MKYSCEAPSTADDMVTQPTTDDGASILVTQPTAVITVQKMLGGTQQWARRERGEREPTSTAGGNVNWCSHSREQCESSLKNQP